MKSIILACLIACAAAGVVPPSPITAAYSSPLASAYSSPLASAPITAAYSSPLAYSGLAPFAYPNFYNAPLAYNAPLIRSAPIGYPAAAVPFGYSASPFFRGSYFRSYPYAF